MKIIGFIIFAAVSAVLLYEYMRSARKRLEGYEALSAIFSQIERGVAEGGRALTETLRSFDFSKHKIEKMKGLILSPRREELRLVFPEADEDDLLLVYEFFTEDSASSSEDELRRIRKISSHTKERLNKEKSEYPDKARIAAVIYCTAVALAFFLLM